MKNVTLPVVGMGASMGYGSDSYPYTIHRVEGNRMWISQDEAHATEKSDYYTNQDYTYTNANLENPENWTLCTFRKDERWHVGKTLKGQTVHVGERRFYQDPSF